MAEPLPFVSTLTLDLGLKLFFAFIAGFIGSLAYVSVLYFKFIGRSNHERDLILRPFLSGVSGIHFWKLIWYCCIGGAIAVIFQYPEPTFVPVQNFLLGVSWPAIVSQHISGRMKSPTEDEINEYTRSQVTKTEEAQAKDEMKKILDLIK